MAEWKHDKLKILTGQISNGFHNHIRIVCNVAVVPSRCRNRRTGEHSTSCNTVHYNCISVKIFECFGQSYRHHTYYTICIVVSSSTNIDTNWLKEPSRHWPSDWIPVTLLRSSRLCIHCMHSRYSNSRSLLIVANRGTTTTCIVYHVLSDRFEHCDFIDR